MKLLKIILLIYLSLAFSQELKVEGNLNVAGNIHNSKVDKFFLLRLEISENQISPIKAQTKKGKLKIPKILQYQKNYIFFKVIDIDGKIFYENLFYNPLILHTEELRHDRPVERSEIFYSITQTEIKIPFSKYIDSVEFYKIDNSTSELIKLQNIKWIEIPRE